MTHFILFMKIRFPVIVILINNVSPTIIIVRRYCTTGVGKMFSVHLVDVCTFFAHLTASAVKLFEKLSIKLCLLLSEICLGQKLLDSTFHFFETDII